MERASNIGAPLMTISDFFDVAKASAGAITDHPLIERVEALERAGFGVTELSLEILNFFPESFSSEFRCAVLDASARGMRFAAHLPFFGLQVLSPNNDLRAASVTNVVRAWRAVEALPIEQFVLHLRLNLPLDIAKLDPLSFGAAVTLVRDAGCRSMDELLVQLDAERLCIENLETMHEQELAFFLDRYKVGFCLDIGHTILRGEAPFHYLDRFGHRLRHVHLHDCVHTLDERGRQRLHDHQPLGTGILELAPIKARLAKEHPVVPIIIETTFADAFASLEVWRNA